MTYLPRLPAQTKPHRSLDEPCPKCWENEGTPTEITPTLRDKMSERLNEYVDMMLHERPASSNTKDGTVFSGMHTHALSLSLSLSFVFKHSYDTHTHTHRRRRTSPDPAQTLRGDKKQYILGSCCTVCQGYGVKVVGMSLYLSLSRLNFKSQNIILRYKKRKIWYLVLWVLCGVE